MKVLLSFVFISFLMTNCYSQVYLGIKAFDTNLKGGGKLGDSTIIGRESEIELEIGIRGGIRRQIGNSFFDVGLEINSYFNTFYSTTYVLVAYSGIQFWDSRESSYTFAGTKLGLETIYGSFIQKSGFYYAVGMNPGVIFKSQDTSIIDEIGTSDYVSNILIDLTLKIGNQLSKKFSVEVFFQIGLNNAIAYNSNVGSFNFTSSQIGISLNYLFKKINQ